MSNTISSWYVPFWYDGPSGENPTAEQIKKRKEELKAANKAPSFPKTLNPAKAVSGGVGIVAALTAIYGFIKENTWGKILGIGAILLSIAGFFLEFRYEKLTSPNPSVVKKDEKPLKPINPESKEDFLENLKVLDDELSFWNAIQNEDSKTKINEFLSKFNKEKVKLWISELLMKEKLLKASPLYGYAAMYLLAASDYSNAREGLITTIALCAQDENVPRLNLHEACYALAFRYKHVEKDPEILSFFMKVIKDKSYSENTEPFKKGNELRRAALHSALVHLDSEDSVVKEILERLSDKNDSLKFRAEIAKELMHDRNINKPGVADTLCNLLENSATAKEITSAIINELGQGYPHDDTVLKRFIGILEKIEKKEGHCKDTAGRSVSSDLLKERLEKRERKSRPVDMTFAVPEENAIWKYKWIPANSRNEDPGTYIWDINFNDAYEIDSKKRAGSNPIINCHRVFYDDVISSPNLVVALDQKGRLCVFLRRLHARGIDSRGHNICIASVSENSTLTETQKSLLTAFLGSSIENNSNDFKMASSLECRFNKIHLQDGVDFNRELQSWRDAAKLAQIPGETARKFNSTTTVYGNTTQEDKSALLAKLIQLSDGGKLTGKPGDVIAVVGNKVSDTVKQFNPRFVLSSSV